jgi:hypothetical protein
MFLWTKYILGGRYLINVKNGIHKKTEGKHFSQFLSSSEDSY